MNHNPSMPTAPRSVPPNSMLWKTGKVETQDSAFSSTSGYTEQIYELSRQPRQSVKSKLMRTWWQLFLGLISLALLAVIVLFVQSSNYAQKYSEHERRLTGIFKIDASTTLSVLRTAQAILSTITSSCLGDAMELIQWTMTNTPQGLPFSNLLALSSATGKLAMTRLLFSDAAGTSARLWTLLR